MRKQSVERRLEGEFRYVVPFGKRKWLVADSWSDDPGDWLSVRAVLPNHSCCKCGKPTFDPAGLTGLPSNSTGDACSKCFTQMIKED